MTPASKKTKKLRAKTKSTDMRERRRADRRLILETFAIFLAIPTKGPHRLQVVDLSENGIGFNLDIENESLSDYPIRVGDEVDLKLYINTSLHIPLAIRVVRIETKKTGRFIGAEFQKKGPEYLKTLNSFLQMLDSMVESSKNTA